MRKLILFALALAISPSNIANASNMEIDKQSVHDITIATNYPMFLYGYIGEPFSLSITNGNDISRVVDFINSIDYNACIKNGEGGNGTAYNITINFNDSSSVEFIQYAYDIVIDGQEYGVCNINDLKIDDLVADIYYNNYIPSYWNTDVEKMLPLNIIPEEFKCNYKQYITREQFCDLIVNALVYINATTGLQVEDAKASFSDSDSKSVAFLQNSGVIDGKENGMFFPNDFITKEEAFTMLGRVNEVFNLFESPMYNTNKFDETTMSSWSEPYILKMMLLDKSPNINGTLESYQSKTTIENAISMVMQMMYCIDIFNT